MGPFNEMLTVPCMQVQFSLANLHDFTTKGEILKMILHMFSCNLTSYPVICFLLSRLKGVLRKLMGGG